MNLESLIQLHSFRVIFYRSVHTYSELDVILPILGETYLIDKSLFASIDEIINIFKSYNNVINENIIVRKFKKYLERGNMIEEKLRIHFQSPITQHYTSDDLGKLFNIDISILPLSIKVYFIYTLQTIKIYGDYDGEFQIKMYDGIPREYLELLKPPILKYVDKLILRDLAYIVEQYYGILDRLLFTTKIIQLTV